MPDIRFVMNLEDGTVLDETDLPADDGALRTRLGDFAGMEGALIIDGDDGEETVFADVLRLLIPAFCLGGLAKLVQDKRQTVSFFNHDETVTLTVADDEVSFQGDQVEPHSLPLGDYVAAQQACGARYVALARRFWRDDPAGRLPLEELEMSLAAESSGDA